MFTPIGQPYKKTVTISHEGDIIDYSKKVILKKPTHTQEKFRGMEGTATETSKPTEEVKLTVEFRDYASTGGKDTHKIKTRFSR